MSQQFRANEKDSKYDLAIVTGGSSGIGNSIIEQIRKLDLAPIVFNLSRQKPASFSDAPSCTHIECDLSDKEARKRSFKVLIDTIDSKYSAASILLVNNAGFGLYGKAFSIPVDDQLELLEVNISALVDLTVRLLPRLKQHGGSIMNISSTSAFQPTPYLATYGASKTFVLNWTIALNEELRYDPANAIAICPGPTRTNFFQRAGLPPRKSPSGHSQTSESVAEAAIEALLKGKTHTVIGFKNRVLASFARFLTRGSIAYLARLAIKKYRAARER